MNKKKIFILIVLILISAVVLYAIVAFFVLFFSNMNSFSLRLINFNIFKNSLIWVVYAAIVVGMLIFALINYRIRGSGRALKTNYGEDAHWLTEKEITQNETLIKTNLTKLHEVKDGIPIKAEKHGKNIDVVLSKPIHTLVIGTTGSGKTSGFVDPVLQILSRTKTKPCMIITDPKGEIYEHHAKSLENNGYKVYSIDLKDIYNSAHWNPFNEIYEKTEKINKVSVEQRKGKYYVNGKEYLSFDLADKDRKVYAQQLKDEIFIDLQDLIYTICPIENKQDSTWQQGARDFLFALTLAFWEDVRDGYMTKEQFNFYNLYKTISTFCRGDMSEIKAYFSGRDKFSKVQGLANTVTVSQDRTLTSYMGDINHYCNWLADNGITSLTSRNDINLENFDEEPSVLFIKIPDEKENRHRVVTLFITQMYKTLVEKAANNLVVGKTKEAELLRNCYFIMDEFGNMPRFNSIDKIITVGRSRKIFMIPIIQDFAQLENKYGKELAGIIRSNCNIKIFIGSTDKNTLNEISELCGKHKTKNISYTDHENNFNVSTSLAEKPLIFPSELEILNDPPHRIGNAIVMALGKSPLKSVFTPVFLAKDIYNVTNVKIDKPATSIFNEESIFFDITKRSILTQEPEINLLDEQDLFEPEDLSESKIFEEMKKIWESVEDKEKLLNGKLNDYDYQQLWNADFVKKIPILNTYIDKAIDEGNNFLSFELVRVKNFIENLCKEGGVL